VLAVRADPARSALSLAAHAWSIPMLTFLGFAMVITFMFLIMTKRLSR
jgi:hypothetical protein